MRYILGILLLCPGILHAQASVAAATSPSMRTIYVQDQRDRGVALADDGHSMLSKTEAKKLPSLDWKQVNARDEQRRKTVRGLLDAGKLQTAEDFREAAFIFQHGQTAQDYLLAHVLAMDAMARGDAGARWIAAATLDRYLQTQGEKQVFGTQFGDEKFPFILAHRTDKNFADEIKAFTGSGTTQQPYDPQLLPDSIRRDFCVPDAERQQAYVVDVNKGKPVQMPRITHCVR